MSARLPWRVFPSSSHLSDLVILLTLTICALHSLNHCQPSRPLVHPPVILQAPCLKLLVVIQAVHEGSRAALRAYGKVSERFNVTSGVRQGCVLEPTLLNIYFDAVIHMSLDSHRMLNRGIRMTSLLDAQLAGNCRKLQLETLVQDLEYADDMALLADSWDALEAMLTSLSTHCQDFGLSISCAKDQDYGSFSIQLLATTRAYPSFPQQDNCGTDLEVNSRICKASQAFGSLSCTLWYQKKDQDPYQAVRASFVPLLSPHCCMVQRVLCC